MIDPESAGGRHEIVGGVPVALYRLFTADGTLLYIGITDRPRARFAEHSKAKSWWPDVASRTVMWCDGRDAAIEAEGAAIRDEHPLHNVRDGSRHSRVFAGDRHKRKPIGYRPPADIWPLLDARAERTGRKASAVITEILREHFARLAGTREDGP